jgi:hypothetical protein
LGFSLVGNSTTRVGGSTFVDLYSSFLFLFYGDRNTFPWEKKKKNCLFLVVSDAGRHVLWWFSVLFVVAGEVAAAIEKKNNKILLIDVWVVETLICVQHFESVVAVFEVVGLFCIFQQCSSEVFFFFFSQ